MEIDPREWNLAPFKYSKLGRSNNEPISNLKSVKLANGLYESYADLNDSIRKTLKISRMKYQVYSDHDGTGTDKFLYLSRYKAISEALERWAYHSCRISPQRSEFGFDLDDSTTGIAAFPSFSYIKAKKHSLYEAYERWLLRFWWESDQINILELTPNSLTESNFHIGLSNLKGYTLLGPDKNLHFSLLSCKTTKGLWAYGFAVRSRLNQSINAAFVELTRNKAVLEQWAQFKPLKQTSNLFEQRLLYFSEESGRRLFESRIENSINTKHIWNIKLPNIVTNLELRGEWSNFTKVWRILFKGTAADVGDKHIFLF